MNIHIDPLNQIVIDGTAIRLGMEKASVEAAIGKGCPVGTRYGYFNHEMAIGYRDGKVEFIEFLGGTDGMLKPVMYGISVFDAPANEVLQILKEKNNGIVGDTENGYAYQFLNLSVGIYREAIPDDVREMIEEAKRFGNPMSDEEICFEMKKANHWATVGVGIPGYYQR